MHSTGRDRWGTRSSSAHDAMYPSSCLCGCYFLSSTQEEAGAEYQAHIFIATQVNTSAHRSNCRCPCTFSPLYFVLLCSDDKFEIGGRKSFSICSHVTLSVCLSLSLCLSVFVPLFLSLSFLCLSVWFCSSLLVCQLILYFSFTTSLSLSLSLSHAHTHTHTLSLSFSSLSLSLSLFLFSLFLSLSLAPFLYLTSALAPRLSSLLPYLASSLPLLSPSSRLFSHHAHAAVSWRTTNDSVSPATATGSYGERQHRSDQRQKLCWAMAKSLSGSALSAGRLGLLCSTAARATMPPWCQGDQSLRAEAPRRQLAQNEIHVLSLPTTPTSLATTTLTRMALCCGSRWSMMRQLVLRLAQRHEPVPRAATLRLFKQLMVSTMSTITILHQTSSRPTSSSLPCVPKIGDFGIAGR